MNQSPVIKGPVPEACSNQSCEERAVLTLSLKPLCRDCARAVAVQLIQAAGCPAAAYVTI